MSPVSPALRYPKENIKQPPHSIQILYATWSNSMSICLVIPIRVANMQLSHIQCNKTEPSQSPRLPKQVWTCKTQYILPLCRAWMIFAWKTHEESPTCFLLYNVQRPVIRAAAFHHRGNSITAEWIEAMGQVATKAKSYQCQVPCHKAESDQGQLCDYSNAISVCLVIV